MAEYDIGDAVKIYTSTPFQDQSTGNPTDPDVVRFKVRTPSGTVTPYVYGTDTEVVKDGTGDYHMIVRPDEAGEWVWRVEGETSEGLALAAEEAHFDVSPQTVS